MSRHYCKCSVRPLECPSCGALLFKNSEGKLQCGSCGEITEDKNGKFRPTEFVVLYYECDLGNGCVYYPEPQGVN